MRAPSLTIGIEEEYQIIDPKTGELKSFITRILEDHDPRYTGQIKAELHQSVVEVGTAVCRTPAEARQELVRLRRTVLDVLGKHGLTIAAAGTHPFSAWETQEITPFERYLGVRQDMADLAQQLLIFGTHVHIGIEDKDFLIDCLNVARYFLPHILCLATSSPFWTGRNTGLKSYRSILFRHFPRSGIPPRFGSWDEYSDMVDTMVSTRCIPDATQIWYDLRPNSRFPTLEFRICDVCTRVDETVCIAALFQALIMKLWKLRQDNMTFRVYPTELIEENKWRAVRYGLDGKLIDLGKVKEVPAREVIHELIDWFLRDAIDELGSRREVEYAYKIMDGGTSADRQLKTFAKTDGCIRAVTDQLVAETREGIFF
ncbi:carboxylate-amine ligase [Fimbriiglobus ruber]|uniref:Putative glutamate--cysteine ligase 2 n=1 Tax=Fimbriiglobus ruber TaxID=1908690 RepID=A0A225DCM1_9BACT|nr:carboxylate-amine ligase [Fimbriiglobus ruber]OWK36288.1 Carboxylate-amine ligase [Fimbriiglobus ruber]